MSTIRVMVNGAQGKMGQHAVHALSQNKRFELVAEAGKHDDLATVIQANTPDVVLDFTVASSGLDNAKCILNSGARAVIGTSGFLPKDIEALGLLCEETQLGAIIAPNFSIGAVLMMQFSAKAAHYLPAVEILEMHHDQKQDSPSGTALKTADMIAENRGEYSPIEGEAILSQSARGGWHREIPIHAMRMPGVIANQMVVCGGNDETLTIRHDTLSRKAFMPGVLLACESVMKLPELVYGLEHIL